MNIKNELKKALPSQIFERFQDDYFIHIAECLNVERDILLRRKALDEYIEIVINEAKKIKLEHQIGRSIYTANRYLLHKYKTKKAGV